MALPVVIAKNQTGSPIELPRLGLTVPASPATITLTEFAYIFEIGAEEVLDTSITAGDIIINDGTSDLSVAESLVYINTTGNMNGPATGAVADSILKLSDTTGRYTDVTGVTVDGSNNLSTTGAVSGSQLQISGTPIGFNDLSDVDTTGQANGDLAYFNGTNWIVLAAGTTGQVLTPGTPPSWIDVGTIASRVDNIVFTSSSGSPYIEVTSSSYSVIGYFGFSGTDENTPSSIAAVTQLGGGASMSVRIVNDADASVIVELAGITDTAFVLQDLGTITNLTTGSSIWRIEMLGTGGGRKARLGSVSVVT
jgi:hypothetical protein